MTDWTHPEDIMRARMLNNITPMCVTCAHWHAPAPHWCQTHEECPTAIATWIKDRTGVTPKTDVCPDWKNAPY